MLEIDTTSRCGHMATKSGRNVPEAEKNICRQYFDKQARQLELWLLLDTNGKSHAAG